MVQKRYCRIQYIFCLSKGKKKKKTIRLRWCLLGFSTVKIHAKQPSLILLYKGIFLNISKARVGEWLVDKNQKRISAKAQALIEGVVWLFYACLSKQGFLNVLQLQLFNSLHFNPTTINQAINKCSAICWMLLWRKKVYNTVPGLE